MSELVIVSAADEAALLNGMARLEAFLDRVPEVLLADVAYTCSLAKGPCAIALVVRDTADLRARLRSARSRLASETLRRIRDKSGTYYFRDRLLGAGGGRLAFVYPGVMSFYPDMMRDLVVENDVCRHAFDELEEALKDNADFTPSSFVFPPADYYRRDADIFSSGAYAQALVATYAGCAALTRLLGSCGVRPDGVVGFAGGDLAAMVRSGAAGAAPSRDDRVRMIRDIYGIVDKAVNRGGLPKRVMVTALLRTPGAIDPLMKDFPPDKVVLAVDFSPRQKTFAVAEDYLLVFLAACSAADIWTRRLALDRPFNTPLCEPLVPVVRKFAATWMKSEPSVCEIYSCATARRLATGLKAAREDTAGRWAKCVRFGETVRRMHADGYRVFVEVGPQGLMTAAIEDSLAGTEHAAVALNSIHRTGRLQIQHALAQLVALGAQIDISDRFVRRGARRLDFGAAVSLAVRRDSEMILSHAFPRLTLVSRDTALSAASFLSEPQGRGAKAARRAAAVAQQARRQRQFDFGAMNPLVSDSDTLSQTPGVAVEISKVFKISELPFLADFALGTSQISYGDPNLKGLTLLPVPVAAEIMAETAALVVPNRLPVRLEDFTCRRMVPFRDGQLALTSRAERAAAAPGEIAVKVQLRDNAPNGAYTWPAMEAVVVLAAEPPPPEPLSVASLSKPRSVHWSGRDIYPARLCSGRRLRGIAFVETWSESGIDYQVTVPPLAGNVVSTRFPVWSVNPLLLGVIVSGFALWRSHERFAGAFSLPFRLRRMTLPATLPAEGAKLNCYLRLTGVTPKSQLCDIAVTDGNGKLLSAISGWEELTERVPVEYCRLVMQPPLAFLTQTLGDENIGRPPTDVASAFVTDVPYPIFERNEELWLRVISRIVLSGPERKEFREMTGSLQRRVEWLFGRIAAKEAVRRFLKDFYQARWSDADVQIWADDSGKPHALGEWSDFLTTKLDIAISHTSQFVVAVAAANARAGVDVESLSRDLSEEFTDGVFMPEELEIAAGATNPSQTLLRFWCAKEAVSKALGTGIRYSPKEMNVRDYASDAGRLAMRLNGAWLDAFKEFRGRDIEVTVKTVRDHALATCFIPRSAFSEE